MDVSESEKRLWNDELSPLDDSIQDNPNSVQASRKQAVLRRAFYVIAALTIALCIHCCTSASLSPCHLLPSLFSASNEGTLVQSPINWEECFGPRFECGTLSVPLDYFDGTLGNASLAVVRYLARDRENVKGMVFVNPGGEWASNLEHPTLYVKSVMSANSKTLFHEGPSGSGVGFLARAGPAVSELLDGVYDIVSVQ